MQVEMCSVWSIDFEVYHRRMGCYVGTGIHELLPCSQPQKLEEARHKRRHKDAWTGVVRDAMI